MKNTIAYLITISIILLNQQGIIAQNKYAAEIDLNKVENDQLKVIVTPPKVVGKNLLYVFPKVVPGTYEQYDFGRFITDFKAYNKKGKELSVIQNDVNSYLIKKAKKVRSLEYLVHDTWDDFEGDKYVFQPGGTNINAGDQFVFNNFGFFGYYRAYPKLPYELKITKPASFYGATSLNRIRSDKTSDVFTAENYVELVDQPIMYAKPDTITYQEGDAKVGIAVYSPNPKINAALLKETLLPLTKATSYILGNIPTDEYWFIFHFFNLDDEIFSAGGGGFGALEHKKSSFYYLPLMGREELDVDRILSTVSSVGAHEFFHILAPLNLHSEEIAYFDFYETEMSEHLWLYEGVTEYLSNKSRVISNLITVDEFIEEAESKIKAADRYKTVSFTEMSKNILDEEMNKQFPNVYMKGAMIAMLLDIQIADASNGERDIIDVVMQLIDDYGINKPFKDEELFDVFTSKTSPEIRQFFTKHVEGAEPLPYKELLALCGLNYSYEAGEDQFSFGPTEMSFDSDKGLLMITPEKGNSIIKEPLAIAKLNGEKLSFRLVRSLLMNPSSGDDLVITHMDGEEEREVVLTPEFGEGDLEHKVTLMEEMSASQQMLFDRLFTNANRK